MRWLIWFLMFAALAAYADSVHAEWEKQDIAMEVLWQGLHVVDTIQTINIAKDSEDHHPWRHDYEELNPLLGKNPTVKEAAIYMSASALVHLGASYLLKDVEPFEVFGISIDPMKLHQSITLGITSSCVENNIAVGVKIGF